MCAPAGGVGAAAAAVCGGALIVWILLLGSDGDECHNGHTLLLQELDAQHGPEGTQPVSILPTVRINGQQYLGTLEVSSGW
jgi:hypothetical protein